MDQNTSNLSIGTEDTSPQELIESKRTMVETVLAIIRKRAAGRELYIVVGICIGITVLITILYLLSQRSNNNRVSVKISSTPIVIATPTDKTTPTQIVVEPLITQPKFTISPQLTLTPTPTPTQTIVIPTSTPIPSPLPTATPIDTQAPVTNISYPQQNGEITYFTDSKVCATMSAPTDNVTSSVDIVTNFAFDADGYSQVMGTGYLCRYELLNGAHTLRYKSQDRAGNMEAERTLSFVVNIPGNILSTPTPTATPSNQ